jgi:hypothetical protein
LIDFNGRDFGFLAGHGAIVDGQVMQVSVDILAKPVVLIASTSTELQPFLGVVNLAMIDIAEMALDAASGAGAARPWPARSSSSGRPYFSAK